MDTPPTGSRRGPPRPAGGPPTKSTAGTGSQVGNRGRYRVMPTRSAALPADQDGRTPEEQPGERWADQRDEGQAHTHGQGSPAVHEPKQDHARDQQRPVIEPDRG